MRVNNELPNLKTNLNIGLEAIYLIAALRKKKDEQRIRR